MKPDIIVDNGGSQPVDGQSRKWVILGVVYICVLAYAVTLQAVPPVLSLIMADLKLSHTQGGLLMSFFALPGLIVSIPAGMLADRYGQKIIGLVSLLLSMSGAAVVATGDSFATLAIGRILSGIGGITLTVIAPQMLVQWFAGKKVGLALGIFNTIFPLGTVASLNLLSIMGDRLGWRACIWVSFGLSLLALIAFLWLYTPAPGSGHANSNSSRGFWLTIKQSGLSIWLVALAWLLFNAGLLSVLTFTPDLLRTSGYSAVQAGFYTSLVMCPALVLNPIIGYSVDRIGHKQLIIGAGAVIWALLVVWIPLAHDRILPLLLMLGILQTMIPSPSYALAAEVMGLKSLGLGYGVISAAQNTGVLLGPAAVGSVRDATGSYQASYILMAIFALLVSVVMVILHLRRGGLVTKGRGR